MAILYLIRHGYTEPSGPDAATWGLSARGRDQAGRFALSPFWESVGCVWSSPEEKALWTVQPAVERYGLKLHTDPRLAEVRRGSEWIEDYEGAVREYLSGNGPERWEPVEAARERVLECIQEIECSGQRVAVVSHGLLLTLYLAALDGTDPFELWRGIGFGRVAVVEDGRLITHFSDPLEVS